MNDTHVNSEFSSQFHPANDSLQCMLERGDFEQCCLGRCEWYGAVLGDGDHNCGPGIGTMDEVGCCRDGPAGDENEQ